MCVGFARMNRMPAHEHECPATEDRPNRAGERRGRPGAVQVGLRRREADRLGKPGQPVHRHDPRRPGGQPGRLRAARHPGGGQGGAGQGGRGYGRGGFGGGGADGDGRGRVHLAGGHQAADGRHDGQHHRHVPPDGRAHAERRGQGQRHRGQGQHHRGQGRHCRANRVGMRADQASSQQRRPGQHQLEQH